MKQLQNKVIEWAAAKGILNNGTIEAQFSKLAEEFHELEFEALLSPEKNETALKTEFGDVLVVLTILAQMLHIDFEECLQLAHNKNANRTGRMVDGTFVKDSY